MKKVLILLFLVLSLGTLYSLEGEAGISLGVLGYSFDFNKEFVDGYVYGRIGSFIYQTRFGLGINVSPFVFYYQGSDVDDNFSLTFANMSINYNLLYYISNYLILGPFVTMNALRYNKPDFIEFRSGIVFSVQNVNIGFLAQNENYSHSKKNSIFSSELLFFEAGYKFNRNERGVFFMTIGFDLLEVFFLIGTFTYGNELGSANNSYDKEPSRRQLIK